MDMMSISSSDFSSQAILSMIMMDKSMQVQEASASQLLAGLDVGYVASGDVGSNIDVYA